MDQVKEFRRKFMIETPLQSEANWHDLARTARIIFTEGLLLHAFRTSADKVALRGNVQKHLKHLGHGATKADIVGALRTRADAALLFKVQV